MNTTRLTLALATAAVVSVLTACGSNPGQSDGYNAFLQTIASECKPLIIGSDNIGEAITFNGLGAIPEHFNSFLTKTDALYHGGITQQVYRDSLTAYIGAGSSNARSFECIERHLPSGQTAGDAPAK